MAKTKEKLTPLQALAKKHKLPTVVELLNKTLKTTGITFLARQLEYDYPNLSSVAKGKRKLPLNPIILLARQHGYTDEDALFMYTFQYLDDEVRPNSTAPRQLTRKLPPAPKMTKENTDPYEQE